MSNVFQVEIIFRSTDKTCKSKRAIFEQKFFSTDSEGRKRFFNNPNKAFIEALFNLYDSHFVSPGVIAWESFNSYDRDERSERQRKKNKGV